MPVTKVKASAPTTTTTTRYPAAASTVATTATTTSTKKKKKKKGKGKAGSNTAVGLGTGHDDGEYDEDDLPGLDAPEPGTKQLESSVHFTANTRTTASSTNNNSNSAATAQAELLAAANELYRRMESEQAVAHESNDGEYWKQLPTHIRTFVESTYAHGASLTASERQKSQAMLQLAQSMVDEATSRFPPGAFPPPFDTSLLSDPKFAERFGIKRGSTGGGFMMRDFGTDELYDEEYLSENDEDEEDAQYDPDGIYFIPVCCFLLSDG